MTSEICRKRPAAMKLGAAGAQVIRVATAHQRAPGLDLPAVLHALAEKGITRLMVEGGARVASSFVAAGLVDEVWLLRGPDADRRRRHRRAGRIAAHGNHAVAALSGFVLAKACERTLYHLRARLMFTGIVTDIGEIVSLTPTAQGQLHRLRIACRYDRADHRRRRLDRLQRRLPDRGRLGRRAAGKTWFDVDAAAETLGMTTAKHWTRRHQAQSRARAEDRRRTRRPYRGRPCRRHRQHRQRDDLPDMARFELRTTRELARFIAAKGSVTLDGVSLTVNTVEDVLFSVLIIPHTLNVTTLGGWRAGSEVNLEVDLMARYAARLSEMK